MNKEKPNLTHIAIRCANLDRSIQFYEQWCGLEIVHRRSDPAPDKKGEVRIAWMGRRRESGKGADFWIVLLENRIPPGPTSLFDHLGMELSSKEAVDAVAERAKVAGLIHWPPEDHGTVVGYVCGIKDPDGNVVEFSFGQSSSQQG